MAWWWTTADDLTPLRAEIAGLREDVTRLIQIVEQTGAKVMGVVEDMQAEVAEETTVIGGVSTLIDTLVTKIGELNIPDPRLSGLLDQMRANKAALAQKVVENTPADTGGGGGPTPTGARGGPQRR